MCLLDFSGKQSPRAEDNSTKAVKFWPFTQAKEAISPGSALLNSCRSASCLKTSTAHSRGEPSLLYPAIAGKHASVLVLSEQTAGEMSLTWCRQDLGVYLGKPTHGIGWSHTLPIPGQGGLHVTTRTWRAAVFCGRFCPFTCVSGDFSGIVVQVT